MWGYMDSHNHGDMSILEGSVGTTHGSFLDSVFAQGIYATAPSSYSTRAHLINFMYSLNPNKGIEIVESGEGGEMLPQLTHWPQWTMDLQRLLWINRKHNAYVQDNERKRIFNQLKGKVEWIRL
ncbi:hypothetical protein V8C44DRAFT_325438, partial [Trichoderma aethiopicum]